MNAINLKRERRSDMCAAYVKKKVLESFVFLPVGNKNEKLQPSLGQRMHTYSLSVLSVETLNTRLG